MIRAGIDSGSRWLGLGIFEDGPPSHPLAYVFGKAITVGREVLRATPKLVTPKPHVAADGTVTPREPYYLTTTREVTEEDECAVASEVMEYLVEHRVECVTIEKVAHVYAGKKATLQGVAAQGTALGQTKGVYTRIAERCMARGIEVRYVLASTWRARLTPMVKAEAEIAARLAGDSPPAGATIKRRGDGLVPLLRACVQMWPVDGAFATDEIEHVCDAAGIVLHGVLPPLASNRKARAAMPRKRPPGPPKPRGKRGEIDKAKHRKRRLALAAERRPALEAARAATGCTCGLRRGRHRKTCPLHVSSQAAVAKAARLAARLAERAPGRQAKAADAAQRATRRARLAAHDRACGEK